MLNKKKKSHPDRKYKRKKSENSKQARENINASTYFKHLLYIYVDASAHYVFQSFLVRFNTVKSSKEGVGTHYALLLNLLLLLLFVLFSWRCLCWASKCCLCLFPWCVCVLVLRDGTLGHRWLASVSPLPSPSPSPSLVPQSAPHHSHHHPNNNNDNNNNNTRYNNSSSNNNSKGNLEIVMSLHTFM